MNVPRSDGFKGLISPSPNLQTRNCRQPEPTSRIQRLEDSDSLYILPIWDVFPTLFLDPNASRQCRSATDLRPCLFVGTVGRWLETSPRLFASGARDACPRAAHKAISVFTPSVSPLVRVLVMPVLAVCFDSEPHTLPAAGCTLWARCPSKPPGLESLGVVSVEEPFDVVGKRL